MPNYIYNMSKTDGKYHEVHTTTCAHLPRVENRYALGPKLSCNQAIEDAIKITGSRDFDGCYYCCNSCHKG